MKFSIVTISYNQSEFINRTIDSVISQTGDVEYIVVDPGSTDGSRAIIDSYGDRIAVRVFEPDKGPSDGLNKGFAVASGDVYGYLNSDDTLEPGALSRVAEFFNAHPDVAVVTGHCRIVGPDDGTLRRMWSEPFTRRRVAYGASVQVQPSTFIRRAAFERAGGFRLENRVAWDAELLVDLYLTGARIKILDAFLSTYRLHNESITNSGALDARAKEWHRRVFERLMGRAPTSRDAYVGRALRIMKHVTQPKVTWERVRKGPIYQRGV